MAQTDHRTGGKTTCNDSSLLLRFNAFDCHGNSNPATDLLRKQNPYDEYDEAKKTLDWDCAHV